MADRRATASVPATATRQRHTLVPELRRRLGPRCQTETAAAFERRGLPFAPIPHAPSEQLFDDPHLAATRRLAGSRYRR